MSRVELGSRLREMPHIVRLLLVLPSHDALITCQTCGAAWRRSEGFPDECRWCARRRQADHDAILRPPEPRGYGYATPDDLTKLGIDPTEDRRRDLERWRHDLQLAVDAQLITQHEGENAWRSATKNNQASTSSTGTNSTDESPATNPSSTASPTVAVGQLSQAQRKRANRRSSSPSPWLPRGAE